MNDDGNRAAEIGREIMTTAQAAEYLKVSKQSLYDACARQEVPHNRIGQRLIFSRPALLEWARGRYVA
tara:strand:+ start:16883 stop:17086 length:204 start_codon:yes stop_codon:yes gene_type:complete